MKGDHPRPESGARAAEALFRAWAPSVARILARLGVPRCDLDDAVQDVFLTAHRRGGYADGPAKEQTWLYEIALRTASNARRRARRKPTEHGELALDLAPSTTRGPHESAELREQMHRVAEAIDRIPGDAKLTFVLSEIEGLAADEVARMQSIPIGTVYSRLHGARKTFRAAYAELATEPDPGLIAKLRSRLDSRWAPLTPATNGRPAR